MKAVVLATSSQKVFQNQGIHYSLAFLFYEPLNFYLATDSLAPPHVSLIGQLESSSAALIGRP